MASKSVRDQRVWSPYETDLSAIHSRIREGDIPPADLLAQALEENKDQQLPSWFISVISAQLRGKLKRKRGRKRTTEWRAIFIELAEWDYQRHRGWLTRRKSSQGLKGWKCLRGQPWWVGPPHERALTIVHALYSKKNQEFRHISLRRLRNLISSRK